MFSLKFFVLDTELLLRLKQALVCGNWSLTFLPIFVRIYYICMLEAILAALVMYRH